MDILTLITEQTAPIALAVVVMYYYNRLVVDVLKERKDMVEAIRAERKEWIETNNGNLQQMFLLIRTNSDSLNLISSNVHSLKNEITKYMLNRDRSEAKGSQGD